MVRPNETELFLVLLKSEDDEARNIELFEKGLDTLLQFCLIHKKKGERTTE